MKSLLYSQEMVLAKKAGRKSQTRRVIDPQPWFEGGGWSWGARGCTNPNSRYAGVYAEGMSDEELKEMLICPWRAGERIYIKETYRREGEKVIYRADGGEGSWQSSLFMEEDDARFVEVVSEVVPQRLQDIPAEDAIAEGIARDGDGFKDYFGGNSFFDPVQSFWSLWEFIQKPRRRTTNPWGIKEACYVSYPWDEISEVGKYKGLNHYIIGNPWVWVIKFEL